MSLRLELRKGEVAAVGVGRCGEARRLKLREELSGARVNEALSEQLSPHRAHVGHVDVVSRDGHSLSQVLDTVGAPGRDEEDITWWRAKEESRS